MTTDKNSEPKILDRAAGQDTISTKMNQITPFLFLTGAQVRIAVGDLQARDKSNLRGFVIFTALVLLAFVLAVIYKSPPAALDALVMAPATIGLILIWLNWEKWDKKRGWIAQIKAQAQERSKKRKILALRILVLSHVLGLVSSGSPRAAAHLVPPPASPTPGGRSLPSVCLAPRLLAQRPQAVRAHRAG